MYNLYRVKNELDILRLPSSHRAIEPEIPGEDLIEAGSLNIDSSNYDVIIESE